MMGTLRLVLGRAGTGKTRYCLNHVARALRRSGLDGPGVVLLVPEQATFQMSRMLSEWRGLKGFVRARVLSFKSLAHLGLELQPVGRPMLGTSRKLVMQQILTVLRGELKFWTTGRPERIADSILSLLDELVQAEMGPDTLEARYRELAAAGELSPVLRDKLADTIRIYREYLKQNLAGLDDPLAYLDRFRGLIDKIDWLKGASLYADGFAGFTGQEYAALAAVMQVVRETHLTLSLDPERLGKEPGPEELNVFWPSEQTYFRLLDLVKKANVTVKKPVVLDSPLRRRYKDSPILGRLEQYLANHANEEPANCGPAMLAVSAEDPRHEVELAAGKIQHLVRDRGWRYRDISIILRELNAYEHLVRYAFAQYKIPYFLDVRRPIAHHPLTRMVQSAVGALAGNHETRWLLRYMKTGLTNVPESAADRIENYVLAHGIDHERWLREWRHPLGLIGAPEDDPTAPAEKWDLETINRHRSELLRPLKQLAKSLGLVEGREQVLPVSTIFESLMKFLKETNVSDKLANLAEGDDETAQMHRQIWDVLVELLEQLRLTLTDRELGLKEFLDILTGSFAELTIGVIPSSVDQVLVGTIERSRHPAVRASLVLGFNEGLWPRPPEEDVVLTDLDREKLACPDLPAKGNLDQHYLREQYLTYIGLTRPSELLWVSFSRRSLSGLALQPSRYFRRLERFCGKPRLEFRGEPVRILDGETPLPVSASNVAGQTVAAVRKFGIHGDAEFWWALAQDLGRRPETREILTKFVEGLCDKNTPEIAPDLARALLPPKVSLSQIESFYNCPFQHFCRYALRLVVRPRYRLEPLDLGKFRHEVMAEAWQTVINRGEEWKQTGPEDIRRIVDESIDRAAEQFKSQVIFSNARNRYILDRTRRDLSMAIEEQLRMLRPGQFKPERFELAFDYEMAADRINYHLVGRIDRIDRTRQNAREWVMVIDYKSRMTMFKLGDWLAGVQLQLPGYLMATTANGERPAGTIFLPLAPQRPRGNQCFFPASGLIAREALAHLAGDKDEYPYCIKINKDGEPSATGPVAVVSEEVLKKILAKTRELISEALKAMAQGAVSVRPYFDGNTSVCPTCDMNGICRFDRHVNHYRGTERLSRADILAQMEKHD